MMVRCSWLGRTRPCGKLFKLRKTCDGYCCIFNYRRTRDHLGKGSSRIRKVLRVNATGPYMGLTVLVDTMTHDYVYPLIATRGLKLLLFKPGDFADASSGGLVEKLLGPRREFFIRLSAQTVAATSEVRSFSPQKRRCLFEDELQERLGMDYSQSDCLVSCRIRSIITLCRCRPFYLPYTEKWATPRPPDGIPGLELEREESIECPECLPSCSDVLYTIRANSAPFAPPNGLDTSHPLLDGVELGNHSIVNLYFERADSVLLRQDVLYYWYDLLSNFGGVCGLFVGASLVSSVELLYFATVRLGQALMGGQRDGAAEAALHQPRPRSVLPADTARWQQARRSGRGRLYWREFKPS
ncbi:sodium channel protein Nach-like [Schistocerca gregaria]|uniref:sodium channel protein Nach-like n=1 Tax=Schistocerca gregaria TaxID=7010 RepID=UPI00211DBC3F|nr:sodium channel protein Nach-like [Schistocerca gregaria]